MLRGMYQADINLGVFQKKNVTGGIYPRYSGGYRVAKTEAPRPHSVGVSIFYREAKHFSLEAFDIHGPNIVRYQTETGRNRWHVIG